LLNNFKIYSEYKQKFPDCCITEKQLKAHIRVTKKELKTGHSDGDSGKVALQPGDFLEKIKQTNSHASRNVLQLRETVVEKLNAKKRKETPRNADGDPESKKPAVRTKAQMLETQVDSVKKISDDLNRTNQKRDLLIDAKLSQVKFAKLQHAFSIGLISKEEFDLKARVLLLDD
jgi:hypothetical protein